MKLNSWGYTLRESGAYTLEEINVCLDLLKEQENVIKKDLDEHPPKAWDIEARRKEIEDKVKAYGQNIVALGELWNRADDASIKVNLPAPPPFTAPVPQAARVEPKDIFKKRTWSFESGKKESFWIGGEANISMQGSREITKLSADGKFSAALHGIWAGEVASASATAESGKKVDPKVHLDVRLVGKSVWSPTFPKDGDNAAGKINKALHGGDKFDLPCDESVAWRFAIGPIPMAARLGFRGDAGLAYGYDVALTAVGGYAGPFAKADAYVQLGVDIGVAGAGIEGELVLIDDELTLRGDAALDFVDEPKLTLDLSASNKIDALSGKISVYAYINYLFGTWRGDKTLWSWKGLHDDWEIFHFKYAWSPTGATAEGDVRAEDVMEVNAQNEELRLAAVDNQSKTRLYDVMKAMSEDLGSPNAAAIVTDRARIGSVSQGLDTNVSTYLTELRQWLGS
jgi:hypothetical protein